MTPLEELQAAHKRLSELRSASQLAPWHYTDDYILRDGDARLVACGLGVANTELIVTLHCTIDAQLALLAEAMEDYAGVFIGDCPYPQHAVALARAINGGEA
jgi:hypothetical protein